MYGDKEAKQGRLQRLIQLLRDGWHTQADLARQTGVNRSTIGKDLSALEQRGVLLQEDDQGRVRFFGRSRR